MSSRWPIRRRNTGFRASGAGDRLGFDPCCILRRQPSGFAAACARRRGTGRRSFHPVDAVWTERPPPPLGPVSIHGSHTQAKVRLKSSSASGWKSQGLASMRWCCRIRRGGLSFNIRGADVSHTPLPLSYALVPKEARPL